MKALYLTRALIQDGYIEADVQMMKIQRDLKLKEDKRIKSIQKASELAGSHTSQVERVLINKKAIEKEGPLDQEEIDKIKNGFDKMAKYQVKRVSILFRN